MTRKTSDLSDRTGADRGAGELEAIVVGGVDYQEADRIVHLLTRRGRAAFFAHGARKSRRRFAGALESFASIRAMVDRRRETRGMATLTSAVVERARLPIREDLAKIALASYVVELGSRVAPEGEACDELYVLVERALDRLVEARATVAARRAFELRLIDVLGYRPELEVCVVCGARPGEAGPTASAPGGALRASLASGARPGEAGEAASAPGGALRASLASGARPGEAGEAASAPGGALRASLASGARPGEAGEAASAPGGALRASLASGARPGEAGEAASGGAVFLDLSRGGVLCGAHRDGALEIGPRTLAWMRDVLGQGRAFVPDGTARGQPEREPEPEREPASVDPAVAEAAERAARALGRATRVFFASLIPGTIKSAAMLESLSLV